MMWNKSPATTLDHKRRTRSRSNSRVDFQPEPLEPRNLMAVGAWLSAGSLIIQADPGGGSVDVSMVGGSVQVRGPGQTLSFDSKGIDQIQFRGSERADSFSNLTAIDSVIYGNAGNDRLNGGKGVDWIYGGDGNDEINGGSGTRTRVEKSPMLVVGVGLKWRYTTVTYETSNHLYGGNGDDTLRGGEGYDEIYGESGDDFLSGGGATDRLDGGAGNDGLYGGPENDILTGGAGADRFLRYNSSGQILDANWKEDVPIVFSDRDLRWDDREVEVIDRALEQLQDRVGGANWILKDTLTDDPLVFVKVRDLGPNTLGRNSVSWRPFDYNRRISILDWNETSAAANDQARGVVIHEIGHNWDGTGYPLASEDNPLWKRFQTLHDQSTKGTYSSDFARVYGQESSQEDWSTVWEMYFGYTPGPSTPSHILRAKLALVDAFFNLKLTT